MANVLQRPNLKHVQCLLKVLHQQKLKIQRTRGHQHLVHTSGTGVLVDVQVLWSWPTVTVTGNVPKVSFILSYF